MQKTVWIWLFFTCFIGLYSNQASIEETPWIIYYSSQCQRCETFIQIALEESVIPLTLKDTAEEIHFQQLQSILAKNRIDTPSPVMLYHAPILIGDQQEILEIIKAPASFSPPKPEKNLTLRISLFSAGFIDGFNPCAFYCLIVLTCTILWKKWQRKRLLIFGLSYISGIFLVYFFIGSVVHIFIDSIQIFFSLQHFLNIFLIILLILFGLLSLYDSWFLKKRMNEKMVLRLSEKQLGKTERYIERYFQSKYAVLSAFILGSTMALLESACTGQIYYPVLFYIAQKRRFSENLIELILYNTGFIIPIIILFLLLIFAKEKLVATQDRYRKYGYLFKLLAGLMSLGLSILLVSRI